MLFSCKCSICYDNRLQCEKLTKCFHSQTYLLTYFPTKFSNYIIAISHHAFTKHERLAPTPSAYYHQCSCQDEEPPGLREIRTVNKAPHLTGSIATVCNQSEKNHQVDFAQCGQRKDMLHAMIQPLPLVPSRSIAPSILIPHSTFPHHSSLQSTRNRSQKISLSSLHTYLYRPKLPSAPPKQCRAPSDPQPLSPSLGDNLLRPIKQNPVFNKVSSVLR